MTTDARKLLVLALAAGAVPALVALALTLRLESRMQALETALVRNAEKKPHAEAKPVTNAGRPEPERIARASDGSEPTTVKMDPLGIPADRIVTYDSFARLWTGRFANEAETSCWRPLEAKAGRALRPMAHFTVTVDAKGQVTNAVPDALETDASNVALHACVAKIVMRMRFPEPGKAHSGPVQADRPPR